jgi:hypothetical protein
MSYHSNHGGPKVNHLSANFLSYILSTDSAVLGPQWTNHSAQVHCTGKEVATDIMNTEDVQHQSDGEVLVYTKNTTNGTSPDSPGYLLVDYEIEFMDRMVNPRLASLPTGLCKWFPMQIGFGGTTTINNGAFWDSVSASSYSGLANSPVGLTIGQVYQAVIDFQNATFGGTFSSGSQATFVSVLASRNATGAVDGSLVYPFTTGTTFYIVYRGSNNWSVYPDYSSVFSANPLVWSATSGGCAFTAAMSVCLVGSIGDQFIQSNIG